MNQTDLFTVALGLQAPRAVEDLCFEPESGEIHVAIACQAKPLACPVCGHAEQPIHDRQERSWQPLHCFQYRAYLHAKVPRVACGGCGKVTQGTGVLGTAGQRFYAADGRLGGPLPLVTSLEGTGFSYPYLPISHY